MKQDETSYLLNSPKNASRLLKGIEDYNNGLGKEYTLLQEANLEKLAPLAKKDHQSHFLKRRLK